MKNVWVGSNGDLMRNDNCATVREKYSYTFSEIKTTLQLRATIRAGQWAWPGGYQLYLLFGDGAPCCFDCARKEYGSISRDTKEGYDASFQIIGCAINYEDTDLICDHCNQPIPAAYAD